MYQISSGIGTNFFMYVGILATTYIAWKFLSSFFGVFFKYFLAKKLSLSMNLKKAGSWAGNSLLCFGYVLCVCCLFN